MSGRPDWHSWATGVLENERPPGPEEDVEEFEEDVDEDGNYLRTAAALELDERFRAEASAAIEDLRFVGARLDDLWLPSTSAPTPKTPVPKPADPEVAVDFEADDDAITRCPHCPDWHGEHLVIDGLEVWREWHLATCPVVANWA